MSPARPRRVLIVNAEVEGRARLAVRLARGRVVEVGTDLAARPDETVLDARGGAAIPGLHDHHVHLRSMVAARSSIALDPTSVSPVGGVAAALRLAALDRPPGGWLRGIGAYGREVEAMDRFALDAAVGDRPVRVQHRGGSLWQLNSRAVDELGVESWTEDGVERYADGTATGRLWRLDHRLRQTAASNQANDSGAGLAALSLHALRLGITGFTDATPGRSRSDVEDLVAEVGSGRLRQRLMVMAAPQEHVAGDDRVTMGPHKILLDDADLPRPTELSRLVAATHAKGTAVAIHCVTAEQLVVAVDALEAAGPAPGDRIEHASVVPPGFARTLAAQGVTVVTQPGFVWDRGDGYLREVAEPERAWLYPCASLVAAGVPVGASSDAPFGPLDPWLGMRAAVSRRTASGAVVRAAEGRSPSAALAMYLGRPEAPGSPRRVAVGQPWDVCLLRVPMAEALRDLGRHQVAGVVVDGEVFEWAG